MVLRSLGRTWVYDGAGGGYFFHIPKEAMPRARYDEGWKEAIRGFFPQFMNFFFPDIAQHIDFSKQVEFLDKELSKISRRGLGRRRADTLVKVSLIHRHGADSTGGVGGGVSRGDIQRRGGEGYALHYHGREDRDAGECS